MNEITRIHIAKTAYDIEISAKKQLEKYIKSLETYIQDSDVMADVEIRMTELLAEHGVQAGGVISADDVKAVRAQLGEPYEFANEEGDIAIGPETTDTSHRLYRSTDDAALGGVLSGIAAYFNVNPLWTRLVFVLLLFISFGFAALLYVVLWFFIPPARTATQKLQLAGKEVTLESIKELSEEGESARKNRTAPILQQVLSIGLGVMSAFIALGIFVGVVAILIARFILGNSFTEATTGFFGPEGATTWLFWLVFWLIIVGMLLAATLFGLIAYALFTKKVTKSVLVSGGVITLLGLASVGAVAGIVGTYSWQVRSDAMSQVSERKGSLPTNFVNVTSVTFAVSNESTNSGKIDTLSAYPDIRYVVDAGPARYELSSLPTAKLSTKIDGSNATLTLNVPNDSRNMFVQPVLTIYGPALSGVVSESNVRLDYSASTQNDISINAKENAYVQVSGAFVKTTVKGTKSTVDLSASSIQTLVVESDVALSVSAGTVRELSIVQPDACPSPSYQGDTGITVAGVTSGVMTYNGTSMQAQTYRTGCAIVTIGEDEGFEQ